MMTITEIEKIYASEWVLVDEPETDQMQQVLGGKVLFHSADRDEVYRKAVELRPKRCAFLFTGSMPEHMVLAL